MTRGRRRGSGKTKVLGGTAGIAVLKAGEWTRRTGLGRGSGRGICRSGDFVSLRSLLMSWNKVPLLSSLSERIAQGT